MTHLTEQQSRAVLVLQVGAMYDDSQDQPQRIDRNVPFAAGDFLASVVAPLAADLRPLDRLAVDARGARVRIAAGGDAILATFGRTDARLNAALLAENVQGALVDVVIGP